MSYTFKITIPDGPLREHLEGRDPKARNFELIRLATNDLVALHHGRNSIPSSTSQSAANNSDNRSEASVNDAARNVRGVSQKKTTNKVNYGSDILNM